MGWGRITKRFIQMKELVEKIVRALVDFPEQVNVREISGINATLLEIKVSRRDMGMLIGKRGKNINALRNIVWAAGKGKPYRVELLGEESSKSRHICKGTITSLLEDRNYGYIEDNDGSRVYFHGSSLREAEIGSLFLGQQVEFEVEESPKGFKVVSMVRPTGEDS